jgi:uncharacterized protein YkwD
MNMPRLCACLVAAALLALGSMRLAAADDPKPEPKLELSKDEKTILELTNKERAKEKLPPLEPNLQLFQAARGHSANMAAKSEMNHILDKKDPSDRVDATGYKWMGVGENIAATDTDTLEGVMKSWMKSELHRANILSKDFRHIGIGLAKDAKGDTYFTQVFATPLKK